MSNRADIFIHFCNDIYRKKMTVEERAELMTDMYSDLDYEDYDLINKDGHYIGSDVQRAAEELRHADEVNLKTDC